MSLTIGTRLGAYEISGSLGAGGMGEVYRARDTRLHRDVALKILPAALASDPVHVERFRREARAIAALTHPNIVTIHSVEEADGVHFLTMELIEGRPLDHQLPATGHSLAQLLEIGMALADALAAAHERGIVHRDLKPANVMVDRHGRVKVLDFGLAKDTAIDAAAQQETLAPLTHAGLIVGTMPYMAPEQIEGRPVDARTDIFALGIVLYELATGERPFDGESSAMLMSAILRDQPHAIGERRPDLPDAFGRLISRCLEKRPNDRIQTARDVYNELRTLQRETAVATPLPAAVPVGRTLPGPPVGPGKARATDPGSGAGQSDTWMAVLPFTSRGGDEEGAALAEGLTEEIAAGLTRFRYLKVAATPERARYRLEGSVRRLGSMIRVAVELKDVHGGVQMWGAKYDHHASNADLFAIQDDVAARVIANVASADGVLIGAVAAPLRERPLDQLTLFELEVRMVAYIRHPRPDEQARLKDAFESRVAADPTAASAWSAVAVMYLSEHIYGASTAAEPLDRALQAAERAVEIDPTDQGGWYVIAGVRFFRRDLHGFRAAADRAVALNPLNTILVGFISHFIAYAGEWERGVTMLRQIMELNPQHPGAFIFMPFHDLYRRGEYEQAAQILKRANMPGDPWMLLNTVPICVHLGRWTEARDAVDTLRRLGLPYVEPQVARVQWSKLIWDTELVDRLVADLERALEHGQIPGAASTQPSGVRPSSGAGHRFDTTSIAVLPFANLSADPENEYFGDGLAEDILNALTGIHGLNVIARTSAFAFKGKSDDVRKIGEALGVGTVLEGSVRRSGSRVRVSAQLVETASGTHLWSQRYDRDITDIFAVQDDVAQAIAVALRGTLAPAAARRYTPGVPAYEAFLKGRAQLIRFTPDAWQRARTYFEEAIALEPDYADPHAELALGYFICGMHGMAPMREMAPFGRAEAARALELDPSNEQPRFVLGAFALAHDYDWEVARAHFAASMKGPNVPVHARWIYASLYLCALGRFDESVAEMKRAVEQDPLNATWHGILAAHLIQAGRVDEAAAPAARANEIEPNYFVSLLMVGETLWAAGRHAEALDALRESHRLAPWFAISAGALAIALRRAGEDAEADRVLATMGPTPRPMWGRVRYELEVGSLDAAADAYERMIADRDPFALVYAASEGTRPLRNHPRWRALAAAMNLPAS